MDRFETAVDSDLAKAAGGLGAFKAVRGEYGSGKTFFARWLQERARAKGFATSEVQVSETETPLHRWETVYRRLVERLATADTPCLSRRCACLRCSFVTATNSSRIRPFSKRPLHAYRPAMAATSSSRVVMLTCLISAYAP